MTSFSKYIEQGTDAVLYSVAIHSLAVCHSERSEESPFGNKKILAENAEIAK